jgi:hypothetical protein
LIICPKKINMAGFGANPIVRVWITHTHTHTPLLQTNRRQVQQPSRTIYSSICVRSRLRASLPLRILLVHTGFPMSAHLSRLRLSKATSKFSDICGAWFGSGSGFGIGFTGTLLLARAPLLLATLLSHTIPFPRVHLCVVVRLVHTSLGSSYLIAHVLHDPPPPTHTALY